MNDKKGTINKKTIRKEMDSIIEEIKCTTDADRKNELAELLSTMADGLNIDAAVDCKENKQLSPIKTFSGPMVRVKIPTFNQEVANDAMVIEEDDKERIKLDAMLINMFANIMTEDRRFIVRNIVNMFIAGYGITKNRKKVATTIGWALRRLGIVKRTIKSKGKTMHEISFDRVMQLNESFNLV